MIELAVPFWPMNTRMQTTATTTTNTATTTYYYYYNGPNADPKTDSVIKMRHTDVQSSRKIRRKFDKFYRVSYFITPFNQKKHL